MTGSIWPMVVTWGVYLWAVFTVVLFIVLIVVNIHQTVTENPYIPPWERKGKNRPLM